MNESNTVNGLSLREAVKPENRERVLAHALSMPAGAFAAALYFAAKGAAHGR